MSLAIGALLGADFHKPELWQAWLHGTGFPLIVHAHTGKYTGKLPAIVVPTVKTSWEQTLNAHYELLKAFVKQTDATHLAIVSESCMPVQTPVYAIQRLCKAGLSTCDGMPFQLSPQHRKRRTAPDVHRVLMSHEQWTCVAREHAMLLLDNEAQVKSWFADCFADNEHYLGTTLNKFARARQIVAQKMTFTEWKGGSHPNTFPKFGPIEYAKCVAHGAVFFRKITANTLVDTNLLPYMSDTPKRRGRPAKATAAAPETAPTEQPQVVPAEQELVSRVLPTLHTAVLVHAGAAYLPQHRAKHASLTVLDNTKDGLPEAPDTVRLESDLPYTVERACVGFEALFQYLKNEGTDWGWPIDDDRIPAQDSEAIRKLLAAAPQDAGAITLVSNSDHTWGTAAHARGRAWYAIPFGEFGTTIYRREVIEAALESIDLKPFRAGWGHDIALAYACRKLGLVCYATSLATVQHYRQRAIAPTREYMNAASAGLVSGMKAVDPNWHKLLEAGTGITLPAWMK